MTSRHIAALRSVSLIVPDVEASARFYTDTWHLTEVAREGDSVYLRGTGPAHHVLSLHPGSRAALRDVTLQARNAEALTAVAQATVAAGGTVLRSVGPIDEPGGGTGVTLRDPDGRVLRVVHGDAVMPTRTKHPTGRSASPTWCSTATTWQPRRPSSSVRSTSGCPIARGSWPS